MKKTILFLLLNYTMMAQPPGGHPVHDCEQFPCGTPNGCDCPEEPEDDTPQAPIDGLIAVGVILAVGLGFYLIFKNMENGKK